MDITYDKLKKYAETALNNEMQSVVAGRDKNSYKFIDLSIYATKLELEETTSDALTKEEADTLYLPVGDYATTDDVNERIKYIDLITIGTAPLHLSNDFGKNNEGDCTVTINGYIDEATSESSGLMSAEDKRKLDALYEASTTPITYQVIIENFTINNGEMISSDGGEYTAQASFGLYEYENGILTNIYLNEDGLNISSNSDWITTGNNLIINVGNNDGNDRCTTLTLTVYITAANGILYSGTASTYICQKGAEAQVTVTSVTCKVETPKYDNISWEGEDTVSVYWDDYAYTIITNYSDGTKTESHSGAEMIVMVYDDWGSNVGGTWSANYSYFNEEPIENGLITFHITSNPTEMERDILYPVCRVVYSDANGEWQTADSEPGVIKQDGRMEYSILIDSFQYNNGESFPVEGGTFEPELSVSLLENGMLSGKISNYSTSYSRKTSSYTTDMQCTFDTNTGIFVVEENTTTHELDGGTVYVSVSYTAPDGTELTESSSVPITQKGAEIVYGDITAEVTYDTVPYAGGTVSPTITYEQSWACSDGTSGVITEGATVRCTGLSMPAKYDGTTSGYSASVDSNGAVTISGHSTLGDTWLCYTQFSISLNGVSTSVYGYVYQEQEVGVTSVTAKVETPKFDMLPSTGGTLTPYWDDYIYTIITTYSDGSVVESHTGATYVTVAYNDFAIEGGTYSCVTFLYTDKYGSYEIDLGLITLNCTNNGNVRDVVYPECMILYNDENNETQEARSEAGVIKQHDGYTYTVDLQYNNGENIPAEGGTFSPLLSVSVDMNGNVFSPATSNYDVAYGYQKTTYESMDINLDTSTGIVTIGENTSSNLLTSGYITVSVTFTNDAYDVTNILTTKILLTLDYKKQYSMTASVSYPNVNNISYAGGSIAPASVEVELFENGISQGLIDDWKITNYNTGVNGWGASTSTPMLFVSKNTTSELIETDVSFTFSYTTPTGETITATSTTTVHLYPYPTYEVQLFLYNGGESIPATGGTFDPEVIISCICDGASIGVTNSYRYTYSRSSYTDYMSYSLDSSTGVLTVNENTKGATISGGRAIVYASCTINNDEFTASEATYLNQDGTTT